MDKWVVDADHPQGHLVAMTVEEEAQVRADRQAGAADAAVDQTARMNAATLRTRAQTALAANATFLALTAPTAVQVRDQTVLLTKETTALIRLLLGLLDSTDGTTP